MSFCGVKRDGTGPCRLETYHSGHHEWETEEEFLERVAPDRCSDLSPSSGVRCALDAGHGAPHRGGGIQWWHEFDSAMSAPASRVGPVASADSGAVSPGSGPKPRFVLIPPYAEAAVARVLTRGAAVYGDRDWTERISVPGGLDAFVDKALRHINEYRRGTSKDQGTGESPIANAIADLLFVLEHEITRGEGK